MDTQRQLYELIRELPEDDAPRLIYADWLDDQGDPRGEFIRIQCELAKLPVTGQGRRKDLERHEHILLKDFREEWTRSLVAFQVKKAKFHRGFLQEVELISRPQPREISSQFSESWRTLVEQEPGLTSVGLYLYRDWNEIKQLARAPQLRALHFNYQSLERREVSQLLRWPIVQGLTTLDLAHNNLRSGVGCVDMCPCFTTLKVLDLSYNRICTRAARALASSPYLRQLDQLILRGNPIGQYGKEVLRIAFGPRVQL
jgi:uncharacterized protein (TIGR02996 family)